MNIQGSIVALITPFGEEDEVDDSTLNELVEWHIQEGTDAIVCCGTTGEAPTLTHQEHRNVIYRVVEAASGRLPIIAGTGSYSTRLTVENTQMAKACGADAALVIVPYYNRPTFSGILRHFEEVAKVGLPLILYHHPGRTGIRLLPREIAEICALPEVIGVKEASGDLDLTTRILEETDKAIFGGDDTLALPMMSIGAQGIISIVANVIPALWKQLTDACLVGDFSTAKDLAMRTMGLCRSLVLETNPQGVKYALSLLGRCHSALRLPLLSPEASTQRQIAHQLKKVCASFCDR